MVGVYSSLSGAFDIIFLLLIFGAVGFVAYFIRKTFYPSPWDSKKVDPKTAAKEELERILVPLETPLTAKDGTVESAPTPKPKPATKKASPAKKPKA
jgi:cytoskeletal protein RodZ